MSFGQVFTGILSFSDDKSIESTKHRPCLNLSKKSITRLHFEVSLGIMSKNLRRYQQFSYFAFQDISMTCKHLYVIKITI
jgi:hypothetical protein